jgi:hypothetical protein
MASFKNGNPDFLYGFPQTPHALGITGEISLSALKPKRAVEFWLMV